MENKETITGELSHIIFSNEDNGYTVARFDGDNINFIAVGILYSVREGEKLELTGEWTEHSTYGEQFKVESFKKIMPTSCDDIGRYLSSGIIKGVRKATATKIIEAFGEDSLKVISEDPERLSKIRGISLQKAYEISKNFNMQLGTSQLFIFLNRFGISANSCMKIYRRYQALSREIVLSDPYLLCTEDCGISFHKADDIAMQNGFFKTEPKRIKAGIIYTLKNALQYGHTYLPDNVLHNEVSRVLEIYDMDFYPYVEELCFSKFCVCEKNGAEKRIYLYEYYKYETYIAKKLSVLASYRGRKTGVNVEPQIDMAEADSSIKFAHLQREAVRLSLYENVMVITGGPGTGKSATRSYVK